MPGAASLVEGGHLRQRRFAAERAPRGGGWSRSDVRAGTCCVLLWSCPAQGADGKTIELQGALDGGSRATLCV